MFDVSAPAPYTIERPKRSNQVYRIVNDANGNTWCLNRYGVVTGQPTPDPYLPGVNLMTFPVWIDGQNIRDHVVATDPTYKVRT